jgi:hypothetical protein
MLGVQITWSHVLLALGAFLAGVGSTLSGIAALNRKRNGGMNGNHK